MDDVKMNNLSRLYKLMLLSLRFILNNSLFIPRVNLNKLKFSVWQEILNSSINFVFIHPVEIFMTFFLWRRYFSSNVFYYLMVYSSFSLFLTNIKNKKN